MRSRKFEITNAKDRPTVLKSNGKNAALNLEKAGFRKLEVVEWNCNGFLGYK